MGCPMEVMMPLGWLSVMLVAGMVLRTKIPLLGRMLVPSSIIGGMLGFALVNLVPLPMSNSTIYGTLVAQLFIISFISIGLTAPGRESGSGSRGASPQSKQILQGALGMGFVWNILYALTPVVGYCVVLLTGAGRGMDPIYGLLVPFAFAQGPGQAAAFGKVFEGYGWENAAMVGVTLAAIGFLFAYVVGVPLAKAGLRRGLGVHRRGISPSVVKGYFTREEQRESCVTTTHSGNIDTLAFHLALVGLVYLLTYFLTWGLATLLGPGIGSTLWGMMFMNGMLVSYLVRFVMGKLGVDHLRDNGTQKRITGWASDYLVVASFMAVQVQVVGQWAVPILATCLVTGALSYVICLYFGKRFGGSNDFERTLGLYGTATGTVPSGIALVRIVDPDLSTTTAVELGAMNLPMMASTATLLTILPMAAGALSIPLGLGLLLAPIPVYLVVMKLCKTWGSKTYDLIDPEIVMTREEESV